MIRLISLISAVFWFAADAAALDFDHEIRRQARDIKVAYRPAPKSMAYFMRHYKQCRDLHGEQRSACNRREARGRYEAYRQAWDQRQRSRAIAEAGEFNVMLEPRTAKVGAALR